MNKNAVYLAVFAALCVLAGVLVGASIAKGPSAQWHDPHRPNFAERAERFMGYGPREPVEKRRDNGPAEMLVMRLNLNEGQKAKVAKILENSRQEIETVGKDLRSTIMQIKEKGDKQIMDILTPQQKEKFKAFLKKLECGRRQHERIGQRGPMMPECGGPLPEENFLPQK